MESKGDSQAILKSTKVWKFLTVISLTAVVVCVIFVCVAIPTLLSQVEEIRDQITRDEFSPQKTRKTRAVKDELAGQTCRQGPPGRDGRDGREGIKGDTGPAGLMGPLDRCTPWASEQITEILRRVSDIVDKSRTYEDGNQITSAESSGAGGAVYVRWGRKTCYKVSELLYAGVVSGSYYSTSGGGNHLCLPLDPEWGKVVRGHQLSSGIWGAEYELKQQDIFSRVNVNGQKFQDLDVPCAVCLAESRPRYVMIPAKMTCPAGWTAEYKGYLMSQYLKHVRSEYVCVDEAPEAENAGYESKDGAVLYFVEAYCGSLPCPSYTEGNELTCVVCTK